MSACAGIPEPSGRSRPPCCPRSTRDRLRGRTGTCGTGGRARTGTGASGTSASVGPVGTRQDLLFSKYFLKYFKIKYRLQLFN